MEWSEERNKHWEQMRYLREKARQIGIRFADLQHKSSAEALALVPREIAERFNVLPLCKEEGSLYIATANPADQEAADTVRFACRCTVRHILAEPGKIREAITHAYPTETQ